MYVSPCLGLNHLGKYVSCNNYKACVDVAYKVLLIFTWMHHLHHVCFMNSMISCAMLPINVWRPCYSDPSVVTVALGFRGFAHSIWGLPHAFGPPLARVKSRDNSSPDTGAADPSRRDASTGITSPATDRIGNADADPCFIPATT
jgi:hypothetical protein